MLNHVGSMQLESERLYLRRFEDVDSVLMYKNWASSSKVTRYVTWFPHQNVEETKQVICSWVNKYADNSYYQWAIVLKTTNEPIGSIGVVRQKDDVGIAEIGYCIGDAFWHMGYTSEALSSVIDFLFSVVGYNRIFAIHDIRNPNSGKVMLKCGMKYEGTFREVGLTKEKEVLTVSTYAILRSEWRRVNT